MKDKIIKGSIIAFDENGLNELNKKISKETEEEIVNIINNNALKMMEEDRREKPAKNLKSKFFSETPLSKEQFEYLKNGEGVDNKDVDGETGFF